MSAYVENNYSEIRAEANVDLYYMMKKNTAKLAGPICSELEARFSQCDLSTYVSFVETSKSLFIRNFELHQTVRKMEFSGQPRELAVLNDIIIVNQEGKFCDKLMAPSGNKIIYVDYFDEHGKREFDAGSLDCK